MFDVVAKEMSVTVDAQFTPPSSFSTQSDAR